MAESDSFFSDYYDNIKNEQKISNLKKTLNQEQINTPIKIVKKFNYPKNSDKSLLLVEKLSQKRNKVRRFRNSFTKEELELVNPNMNSMNQTVDIDENAAFNLANIIVKRRFKYFGLRRKDEEDDLEIKKRLMELKKIEEEKKRREKERREKEIREKERREREEKERREREEKERREREERERKEKEERERKEKLKQKELMKTVEINIEERNRRNHNYKIVSKLTKEIEILNSETENTFQKNKEAPQNENFFLKNFKITPSDEATKTLIVSKSRPQINTRQIKTPKKDLKIEVNKKKILNEKKDIPLLKNKINSINVVKSNITPRYEINNDKKIIVVNKAGNNRKNIEINKIIVQKNVTQQDIFAKKNINYKVGENVRNKYKNKNNNKIN